MNCNVCYDIVNELNESCFVHPNGFLVAEILNSDL